MELKTSAADLVAAAKAEIETLGVEATEKAVADGALLVDLRHRRGAATTLKAMGYTNVAHLDGGFNAWSDAGRPTESG